MAKRKANVERPESHLHAPVPPGTEGLRPYQVAGSDLRKLLDLTLSFTEPELKALCNVVQVEYDALGGSTHYEKAAALLVELGQREELAEFVRAGRHLRPELEWPTQISKSTKPFMDRASYLSAVLQVYFNDEELRNLCLDLGIEYESLRTDTAANRAMHLVVNLWMHGKLGALEAYIRQFRPEVSLSDADQTLSLDELVVETLEVLAEAKLILVGDGNVGKTSLVNCLVHEAFDPDEDTTRGVAIDKWFIDLPHPEVQRARLNIWDFGGQGNMHATHPYFFSRRAVYLVVLNVREDERAGRVEYWLRMIRTYGAESPVIIVANKIDQHPAWLDERTLKDKYPNITGFVRTSCVSRAGIPELRAAIANAVCGFDDIAVRTPASFVRLKQALEQMTDPSAAQVRDTLSMSEYEALCDEHGVDPDQRAGFLRRLNDLGVMLYFGDDARLELNVVLNPLWVTEGIYTMINHPPLAKANGRLRAAQIRSILPKDRFPADKAMYILDMMRKFELCFALDDKETLFLLPDLLPPQQPALPAFDRAEALQLHYEYPVWQGATLTRLLVRLNTYLVENAYWRNGALLQSSDKRNRALVIADEVDRRLRIWVDGHPPARRSLLNRIREELNVIHGSQRDQIKEWVIAAQGGEVDYQLLVGLEAQGATAYPIMVSGKLVTLNVIELLDGVRAEVMPDSYRLKELIVERLSLDELDDLCFRLKISLENIEGEAIDAKARNLIRQFERTRRMPELMAALRELRQDVTWA